MSVTVTATDGASLVTVITCDGAPLVTLTAMECYSTNHWNRL